MIDLDGIAKNPSRHDFAPLLPNPEDLFIQPGVFPESAKDTFGVDALYAHVIKTDMQFAKSSLSTELKTRQFEELITPPSRGTRSARDLEATQVWYEAEGERADREFDNEISFVRESLSKLAPYEAAPLEIFMERSVPAVLRRAKSEYAKKINVLEMSWQKWLTHASDAELINVLEWHNHAVAEQQMSRELRNAIEATRAEVKEAVIALEASGTIIADPQRIDLVGVRIGDVFDTYVEGMRGYHRLGSPYVVIGQGIGVSAEEREKFLIDALPELLPHEFSHGFLDQTHDKSHNPLKASWYEEPLTEKMSLLIRQHIARQNHLTQPVKIVAYHEEDGLFDTLLSGQDKTESTQQINLASAFLAYTGGYEMAMKFSQQLDQTWGYDDVLVKVSEAIRSKMKEIIATNPDTYPREVRATAVKWVQGMMNANPGLILRAKDEEPIAAMMGE